MKLIEKFKKSINKIEFKRKGEGDQEIIIK